MIELISILASLVIIILLPFQMRQIITGKISKRFKGTREQYLEAFGKQLKLVVWLGIVAGVLNLAMIAIETTPGERIVKLVAAVLWFGVTAVCLISQRKLAGLASHPSAPQP